VQQFGFSASLRDNELSSLATNQTTHRNSEPFHCLSHRGQEQALKQVGAINIKDIGIANDAALATRGA
jgi:hypothetical protein